MIENEKSISLVHMEAYNHNDFFLFHFSSNLYDFFVSNCYLFKNKDKLNIHMDKSMHDHFQHS